MKQIKRGLTATLLIIFILTALPAGSAGAAFVGDIAITSQGACILDFETGIQLYVYREDVLRVPASMTKMLTVYLIYDAIKAGEIKFDTVATISDSVSSFSYNREYSNVPLPKGLTVTIDSLLDVVIVNSACAAATALGEALCGSEEAFVGRMNDKVKKLGVDAVFYDAFGGSPDNMISPYGMAVLSRNLLIDHPEVLKKSQQKTVVFRGSTYKNTNPLLDQYDGVDGLKTGYTDPAMYCFTATAERDGRRLITVTMGSSTGTARGTDSKALLDYGFAVADSVIAMHQGGGEETKGGEDRPGGGNDLPGGNENGSAPRPPLNSEGFRYIIICFIEYLQAEPDRTADLRLLSSLTAVVLMQFRSVYAEEG